jgi:poly-gamma-glutamate synthesis protein (capsule biosynthesis protein)
MKNVVFLFLLWWRLSRADTVFAEGPPRFRALFVGDVMTHKEQIEAAQGKDGWDFSPQFRRVEILFRSDAFTVANLETVFAGKESGYAGYPSFNTPDALADALSNLGIEAVTLANNHILDRGTAGADRTTEILDRAGILWTGLAKGAAALNNALTVEREGFRIALVSYSYGSNRSALSGDVRPNLISDEDVISGLLHARRSNPDVIVACFHWGNEYQFVPTKRQREIASLCVKHGASLVIGTHPHVLQPVEVVSSDSGHHAVAYSLGNFVSYQRTPPRERSVVLAADFEKTGEKTALVRVSVAPIWTYADRSGKKLRIEVLYAGENRRFNHAGLSADVLGKARAAGKAALDFLGAVGESDEEAFYTLWDAASPDVLPKSVRKTPE